MKHAWTEKAAFRNNETEGVTSSSRQGCISPHSEAPMDSRHFRFIYGLRFFLASALLWAANYANAFAQDDKSVGVSDETLIERVVLDEAPLLSEDFASIKSRLAQKSVEEKQAELNAYKNYVDANFDGDDKKRAYLTMLHLFPIHDSLPHAEAELWTRGGDKDRMGYLLAFGPSSIQSPSELSPQERRYLCDRIEAYYRDITEGAVSESPIRSELHELLNGILRRSGDEGVDTVLKIYPNTFVAIDILGSIGTERAFDEIYRYYFASPSMDSRLEVADALATRWGHVLNNAVKDGVLSTIDEALNSENARYRKIAIGIVASLEDERFLPKLHELAASDPSRDLTYDDGTGTNTEIYDNRELAAKVIREFEGRRRPDSRGTRRRCRRRGQ